MDQCKKQPMVSLHNERAWDYSVETGLRWTTPLDPASIERARRGEVKIFLSPKTPIPEHWLGELRGQRILGLASGGGQQGPLLAAAGAEVTVLDISNKQLAQDKALAEREGLSLKLVKGNAESFPSIPSAAMDAIVNPCSSCFFENLQAVWSECARVLRAGGTLVTAFINPAVYAFDFEKANRGVFELKYPWPYSDLNSLDGEEKRRFLRPEQPLEFGHSLSAQLGGLCRAGFDIVELFEDSWDSEEPMDRFIPPFVVLCARRRFSL